VQIAERELLLRDSGFVRILKLAAESKGLISLGPGEPDFDTPGFVRAAAKKALDQGKTHYSAIQGMPALREAIAAKFKREKHVHADPDKNVIVTCGSNEALFLAFMSVLDPGEEVLVPDPCFLGYLPAIESMDAYPVSIQLKQEERFQLIAEDVRAAIKDPKRVRAIVLSSPSNPTGTIFKKKSLEELADLAIEHDFLVFMDEAYEKFCYKGKPFSFASLNGVEDHCVTFQSFSKTYAMPGFRLGYAVGPEKLITAMSRLHTYTTLCAPTMSQIAGVAALNGPQSCVEKMRREYDRRRKLVVKRLGSIPGFELAEPDGAFYAFPRISFRKGGKPLTSTQYCELLLKEAKVLAVPGTEFGRFGEGFIRLSYATSLPLIEEALDRIEKHSQKLES